jgi:hypothetical protein
MKEGKRKEGGTERMTNADQICWLDWLKQEVKDNA